MRQLELLSCREEGDPAWVPVCLQVSQRSLHVLFTGTDADTIPELLTNDHVLFSVHYVRCISNLRHSLIFIICRP